MTLADRVLTDHKDDLLNRASTVDQAEVVLLSMDRGRGGSIAIFGPWGSGKSTIASWLVARLDDERWVKVNIPSWHLGSVQDFWAALGSELYSVLVEKNLLEGFDKSKAGKTLRSWQSKYRDLMKDYAFAKDDDRFGTVASALEAASTFGRQRVAGFIETLNAAEFEIVVVVDDMDRMDPKALPHLLLAMQEIFSECDIQFIVPVDRAIAKASIEEYSDAWSNVGELFLEKVFDYQISIPPPTPAEKLNMIERLLRDQLSEDLLADIPERVGVLLPEEPRRIKSIATEIRLARDVLEDHGNDEISYEIVLVAAIAKAESHIAYQSLVRNSFDPIRSHEQLSTEVLSEKLLELCGVFGSQPLRSQGGSASQDKARLSYWRSNTLTLAPAVWQSSMQIIAGVPRVSRKTFERVLIKAADLHELEDIQREIRPHLDPAAICSSISDQAINSLSQDHLSREKFASMTKVLSLIFEPAEQLNSRRTQKLRASLFLAVVRSGLSFSAVEGDEVLVHSDSFLASIGNSLRSDWRAVLSGLQNPTDLKPLKLTGVIEHYPGAIKSLARGFFEDLYFAWSTNANLADFFDGVAINLLETLALDVQGKTFNDEEFEEIIGKMTEINDSPRAENIDCIERVICRLNINAHRKTLLSALPTHYR